ncbi:MAG: 2'-5' RNA ligase family protein [Methanomicrobia archaeon]|nr:2'-5' RNA ligase family protein [Methanomicrobia archaeon]
MTHYLIEFRFFGKARGKAKKLIRDVDRKCDIKLSYRPVPHVTLAGPFHTQNEGKLVSDFNRLCKKYEVMKYKVVGFNTFKDNRVVYIDINPSEKLDEFRWELSKAIKSYCRLKSFDLEKKFYFHATVAMNLTHEEFKCVNKFIRKKTEPDYKHIMLRAAIIKNSRILYEYDFMLKRLLNRGEAKSKRVLAQSFKALEKYFEEGKTETSGIIKHIEKSTSTKEFESKISKKGFLGRLTNAIRKRKFFFK